MIPRLAAIGALAAAAAASGTAFGATAAGSIQPSAERLVGAPAGRPPPSAPARAASDAGDEVRVPPHGPKVPEALRARLQARLDARVDADLAQSKRLRVEALALLRAFVAEAPRDSNDMPEALVRLGELEWEDERESFVDRFQAWERRPAADRGAAPRLDYRESRAAFARVLRDYPGFADYDVALYVDGFLAFEQGDEDEALDRFERILRDYPRSRFVPDAHMAKAEAIFSSRHDYAAALAEYEQVLSFRGRIDPALYGLALFKSAWCHWRLGNAEEAARRFVGVFEASDASASAGERAADRSQRKELDELQGEALKYVVQVFTEDEKNTADDLYAFLAKIGGARYSVRIIRALAQQFYDQAHYERGIEAYRLLLRLEPASPEAGRWMLRIADGYAVLEDWPDLRSTFERALAEYTAGSGWSRAQPDPANVAATTAAIQRSLRDDAASLHAKAQHDGTSRAEFEGAAGLYETYLSKFEADPNAYEIHFYLGEIDFFHLARNLDAATHYLAAARGVPAGAGPGGALAAMRHDALYDALVALSRAMDAKLDARVQTQADEKYGEALDLYAKFYPDDPQLPAMFYRQGKSFFDGGRYDAAVKVWGRLLEKFPSSPPARDAGDSILESFNRAKDYVNIETWARRLKALPSFAAPQQQDRLDALIVQAVFKQGEQRAAAGDHAAAAAAYLRAAKEFPRDSRAAQACVDAEQEAKAAGDAKTLEEAAGVAMGPAYRDRPESPLGAWIATTTLQAMGLLADAADVAERMAALGDKEHPSYAKFEHERDAAYDAVVLREATGDHERAVADGARFLAEFGASPEADDVVLQMGRAHQDAGRARDAAELYKRYLARAPNLDHRAEGLVLLAQAELNAGDERASEAALDEAVGLGRRRARDLGAQGKFAAAHARYMQGERVLARFEQIRIEGDVQQLKSRLRRKTELLKDAAKTFLDCAAMGVAEWTTAALYQIGHMYEAFAKALRDSPPPPDVKTDEQKADFQAQIEEFAVPMEERSLDAYENGWKKALDLGIYNQWTAKMREALGRLNSELYAPFKETGFEVRSQGPLPLPPLVESPGVRGDTAR